MSDTNRHPIASPAGSWAPPGASVVFLIRAGEPLLVIEVGDETVGVHLHDSTSWLRVLSGAWAQYGLLRARARDAEARERRHAREAPEIAAALAKLDAMIAAERAEKGGGR